MNFLLSSMISSKVKDDEAYTILSLQGQFEVRLYHRQVVAKIAMPLKGARKHLEGYLVGNNLRLENIQSRPHYFEVFKEKGVEAGVILDAFKVTSDIPRPVNRLIRLEEMPPRKMGVLRLKEPINQHVLDEKIQELKQWLKLNSYRTGAEIYLFTYDQLFTIKKEIQINVF